jgi:hypothetical protein
MEGSRRHVKKKFTPAEDLLLREVVTSSERLNWAQIASHFPERNGRQCRDRWVNYVNPTIINAPWTSEEERILYERFREFGTKWKQIADSFPNRSANQIKNHWLTKQRRMVRGQTPTATPPAPEKPRLPPPPKPIDKPDIADIMHKWFPCEGRNRNPWEDFF